MSSTPLASRNLKGVVRDPLSLGLAVALPVGLLLILLAVGRAVGEADAGWLTATQLTPGIVLFGVVMLMFASAMVLSRDRDSSLLARLFTAPVSASGSSPGTRCPTCPSPPRRPSRCTRSASSTGSGSLATSPWLSSSSG